jgi:hypothetical protein
VEKPFSCETIGLLIEVRFSAEPTEEALEACQAEVLERCRQTGSVEVLYDLRHVTTPRSKIVSYQRTIDQRTGPTALKRPSSCRTCSWDMSRGSRSAAAVAASSTATSGLQEDRFWIRRPSTGRWRFARNAGCANAASRKVGELAVDGASSAAQKGSSGDRRRDRTEEIRARRRPPIRTVPRIPDYCFRVTFSSATSVGSAVGEAGHARP